MTSWFDQLVPIFEHGPYLGVFTTLVLCGVGLPVPEEVTFIVAGYLVGEIDGSLWMMIAYGMAGILLGDSIIYMMGKRYGYGILNILPFHSTFGEDGIERARRFFQRHGSKAAFFAGFVAGLRAATFFVCGTMRTPFSTFLFLDFVRAALTCPISIYLGFRYGRDAMGVIAQYKGFVLAGLVLIAILLVVRHRPRPRQIARERLDTVPVPVSTSSSSEQSDNRTLR